MTVHEMSGPYKYVRLDDDTVVFGELDKVQHYQLVPTGRVPVSAGAVMVEPDVVVIIGKRSETLNVGYMEDDKVLLEKILGRPVEEFC